MKAKTDINTEVKRLRVSKIELRVRDDELRNLRKAAEAHGVSLSEYVRRTIEQESNTPVGRMSGVELQKKQYLHTLKVKDEFKRISSDIHSVALAYKDALERSNSKNLPVMNAENTVRTFNALISSISRLQETVNGYFHEFGVKEEFYVRNDEISVSAQQPSSSENLKTKYCYMQKITIIGKLMEDAGTYQAKDGKQKVRFRVLCLSADGKAQNRYTVFASQNDILPLLVKDKSVYVEGGFSINEKAEILIFAETVRVFE